MDVHINNILQLKTLNENEITEFFKSMKKVDDKYFIQKMPFNSHHVHKEQISLFLFKSL